MNLKPSTLSRKLIMHLMIPAVDFRLTEMKFNETTGLYHLTFVARQPILSPRPRGNLPVGEMTLIVDDGDAGHFKVGQKYPVDFEDPAVGIAQAPAPCSGYDSQAPLELIPPEAVAPPLVPDPAERVSPFMRERVALHPRRGTYRSPVPEARPDSAEVKRRESQELAWDPAQAAYRAAPPAPEVPTATTPQDPQGCAISAVAPTSGPGSIPPSQRGGPFPSAERSLNGDS